MSVFEMNSEATNQQPTNQFERALDEVNVNVEIRNNLLAMHKQEIERTRNELVAQHNQALADHLAEQKNLASLYKRKMWCSRCEAEAIYYCCWNTAYCSVTCQQVAWSTHRKFCRRR